jgi:hypothetical protein
MTSQCWDCKSKTTVLRPAQEYIAYMEHHKSRLKWISNKQDLTKYTNYHNYTYCCKYYNTIIILVRRVFTYFQNIKSTHLLATVYARSGVNQMWIIKNSKELSESLKSPIFSQIYSINTYNFTTLYTTIPRDKLMTRLFAIIDSCFCNKNGTRKYSYLVVNHSHTYFVIHDSDSKYKYSEVKGIVSKLTVNFWMCQKCGKMKDYNQKMTTNIVEWLQTHHIW